MPRARRRDGVRGLPARSRLGPFLEVAEAGLQIRDAFLEPLLHLRNQVLALPNRNWNRILTEAKELAAA